MQESHQLSTNGGLQYPILTNGQVNHTKNATSELNDVKDQVDLTDIT